MSLLANSGKIIPNFCQLDFWKANPFFPNSNFRVTSQTDFWKTHPCELFEYLALKIGLDEISRNRSLSRPKIVQHSDLDEFSRNRSSSYPGNLPISFKGGRPAKNSNEQFLGNISESIRNWFFGRVKIKISNNHCISRFSREFSMCTTARIMRHLLTIIISIFSSTLSLN